jgi:hypothetical protein
MSSCTMLMNTDKLYCTVDVLYSVEDSGHLTDRFDSREMSLPSPWLQPEDWPLGQKFPQFRQTSPLQIVVCYIATNI